MSSAARLRASRDVNNSNDDNNGVEKDSDNNDKNAYMTGLPADTDTVLYTEPTTTTAAAAVSMPTAHTAPFLLLSKLKAAVRDVVTHLDSSANVHDVDAYIAVTEDCLKALRTLKVQHRITVRRQQVPLRVSNVSPRGNKGGAGATAPVAATTASTVVAAATSALAPATPMPTTTMTMCAVAPLCGGAAGAATALGSAPHSVSTRAHTPPPSASSAAPTTTAAATLSTTTTAAASLAPSTRTYASVLLTRTKKVSPKRVTSHVEGVSGLCASVTRDDVESARHASALRSEERQRQAEERRLDFRQEMKLKLEAADARGARAKERREDAERRQRLEAQDRMESTRRRAEEARRQTVERVQRAHSHVDEVRLTNELRRQTKAMRLDKKMSDAEQNQEHLREERQRVMQERQEAMLAAAERRRNLSQERLQRQAQREQQRQEHLRRVEEQRRAEMHLKQQRAEEWEKKVQQHHADAHAENEALLRKTEEKLHASAQLREGQRERLLRKLEKEEQRQRDARLRRERDVDKATASMDEHEVPHLIVLDDDESTAQRVTKVAVSSARQMRTFVDQYQKESSYAVKDLNRSRLRPHFGRLTAALAPIMDAAATVTPTASVAGTVTVTHNNSNNNNGNGTAAGTASTATLPPTAATLTSGGGAHVASVVLQCRQPLSELFLQELTDMDHEYVRYFNGFDVLLRIVALARRARCGEVLLRALDALHTLLTHEHHGREHVVYFVRSGGVARLMLCARDEAKAFRRTTGTDALRGVLTLIDAVLERVTCDVQGSLRLVAVREQVVGELEATGLERLCAAVLRMSPHDDELGLVYSAVVVMHAWVATLGRRKGGGGMSAACLRAIATGLFALLQDVLVGSSHLRALADDDASSCTRTAVLFVALRTLNMLARAHLPTFQQLLHDAPDAAGAPNATTAATPNASATTAAPTVHAAATNDASRSSPMASKQHAPPPPPQPQQTSSSSLPAAVVAAAPITRMELVHMMHCLFTYVQDHLDCLETISPPVTTALLPGEEVEHSGSAAQATSTTTSASPVSLSASLGVSSGSSSFHDAVRFGVTLASLPPYPGGSTRPATMQHAGVAADAGSCHLRAVLHECLLLVGYLCLDDGALQEMFSWGSERPLLCSVLRALPSHYFANARHIFFPTLLAIIYDNDRNALIARQEMSLKLLLTFVQDEYNALSKRARVYAQAHHAALLANKLQADPRRALRLSVKGKNWAQLTDDDDDTSTATLHDAAAMDAVTTSSTLEKEKLCRTLRMGNSLWYEYFRLERRVPVTYWPSLMQQLDELLCTTPA